MLNEPLPCPFCGDSVKVEKKFGDWGYSSDSVSIQCKKCNLFFMEETEKWSKERGNYRTDEESLKKLLIRWNTRIGVLKDAE